MLVCILNSTFFPLLQARNRENIAEAVRSWGGLTNGKASFLIGHVLKLVAKRSGFT